MNPANRLIIELIEQNMDNLPEPFDILAKAIGAEGVIKLCESLGGQNIYIPMVRSVGRSIARKAIQSEFDGENIKALARKYGYSERTIYSWVTEWKLK